MPDIQGINIAAPVVPYTTDDIYATHHAVYGKGGFRSVASLVDRNSIAKDRLEVGMIVNVLNQPVAGKTSWYELISISTGAITNINWKEILFSGQATSSFVVSKVSSVGALSETAYGSFQGAIGGSSPGDTITIFGGTDIQVSGVFASTDAINPAPVSVMLNGNCVGNVEVRSGNNIVFSGNGSLIGSVIINGGTVLLRKTTIDISGLQIIGPAVMYNSGNLSIENSTIKTADHQISIDTTSAVVVSVDVYGILNSSIVASKVILNIKEKNYGSAVGLSTLWSLDGKPYEEGQLIHNTAGMQFIAARANASHGTEPTLPLLSALAAYYRFIGWNEERVAIVETTVANINTSLRPIYNLVNTGNPVPYDDFNSAADGHTSDTFILNRGVFRLTRAASIGSTWIIGNLGGVVLEGFSFTSIGANFTDFFIAQNPAVAGQVIRIDSGILTNCSLPVAGVVTITHTVTLDNCGVITCPIIGTGTLKLRNGTIYAGPALPSTITLIKEDVKTVNGASPDPTGNVVVVGSANTSIGGLQTVATHALLLEIPAALRATGMEVNVFDEAITGRRGRWTLSNDKITWIKTGQPSIPHYLLYDGAGPAYQIGGPFVRYNDPNSGLDRLFRYINATPSTAAPMVLDEFGDYVFNTAYWTPVLNGRDVVPFAIRLYTTPGQATDGSFTQKASSDANSGLQLQITNNNNTHNTRYETIIRPRLAKYIYGGIAYPTAGSNSFLLSVDTTITTEPGLGFVAGQFVKLTGPNGAVNGQVLSYNFFTGEIRINFNITSGSLPSTDCFIVLIPVGGVLENYSISTLTRNLSNSDPLITGIGILENRIIRNTNAVALLAPLASPSFTGSPTAPTQPPTTVGSGLATLDYVQQSFSGTAARLMAVSYDGTIVANSGAANQFNVTGGKGVNIATRPLITIQAFFGGSSDVDLNGFRYECIAFGFHLYGGGKIFRNGAILGNIVARGGTNTNPIEIYGGCIFGQFETAADTANPIYILDNVRVYPRVAGLLPVNLDNAPCKFIMRNGSQFVGCFPGSNAVVVYEEVPVKTAATLTFEKSAEYTPISAGTFTVELARKAIGAVVVVYLTPGTSDPTINLSPAQFQTKSVYTAGKNLEYVFKVGANGFIQYTINILD